MVLVSFLLPLQSVCLPTSSEMSSSICSYDLVCAHSVPSPELSAGDVVGRFGPEGLRAHRLASGLDDRPPDTRPLPPELTVGQELDPPAERVDTAAFVAKALADELTERLGALGLACTRLLVEAETEHGEQLARAWRHEGSLGPGDVADRVRWQLDGWLNGSSRSRPTGGLSLIRLVPDEVVPATGRQLGFWGTETQVTERAIRALARVEGILGPDSVTVAELRGGRGPGDQVRRVPVGAVDLESDRPLVAPDRPGVPWPGRIPSPAPAVVATKPVVIDLFDKDKQPVVVDGRGLLSGPPAVVVGLGDGPHHVDGWVGPWPADERWWDPVRHRRKARLQVTLDDGAAHLLTLKSGQWHLEATYD